MNIVANRSNDEAITVGFTGEGKRGGDANSFTASIASHSNSAGAGAGIIDDKAATDIKENKKPPKLDTRENFLFKKIRDTRQTLPFCKKWLKNYEIKGYQIPLKSLVKKGVVNSYPPIMSQKDSVVVQFEHTIFVGPKSVNVLSKGDDY